VDEAEVFSAIRESIAEIREGEIEAEAIQLDTPLWPPTGDDPDSDSLCLDSLDMLELFIMLEELVGVTASDEIEFAQIQLVRDLVEALIQMVPAPGATR
jgi:acyl carrier protein